MGLFVLDVVLWLLGVRGHIPQFDDFHPVPATSLPGAGGAVMRMLATIIVVLAAVSLAIWAAVWLTLRLL